jgi:hypothetical protein
MLLTTKKHIRVNVKKYIVNLQKIGEAGKPLLKKKIESWT